MDPKWILVKNGKTMQKQLLDDRIYSHSQFLLHKPAGPQRLVPVGRWRLPPGPQDGATYITVTALLLLSRKIDALAQPPTRLHAVGVRACSSHRPACLIAMETVVRVKGIRR